MLEKNDIKNRRVLNVEMVNAGQEIADFFNITTKDKVLRLVREIRINNNGCFNSRDFFKSYCPFR